MPNNIPKNKLDDIFEGLEVDNSEITQEKPKVELKEHEFINFEQEPKKVEKSEVEAKPLSKAVKVKDSQVQNITTPEYNQLYRDVETILEKNLTQIYYNIPSKKQAEFKRIGEETASKISQLLSQVKLKANKIYHLIIKWLKIIPGINKHYIEQEAKIKTDQLIELRNKDIQK